MDARLRKVRHYRLYAPGTAAIKLAKARELLASPSEEGSIDLEKEAILASVVVWPMA